MRRRNSKQNPPPLRQRRRRLTWRRRPRRRHRDVRPRPWPAAALALAGRARALAASAAWLRSFLLPLLLLRACRARGPAAPTAGWSCAWGCSAAAAALGAWPRERASCRFPNGAWSSQKKGEEEGEEERGQPLPLLRRPLLPQLCGSWASCSPGLAGGPLCAWCVASPASWLSESVSCSRFAVLVSSVLFVGEQKRDALSHKRCDAAIAGMPGKVVSCV